MNMRFSPEELEKFKPIYEKWFEKTQSPIYFIKQLRESFGLDLAQAKDVFDHLHYAGNHEERQKQVEEMIRITEQLVMNDGLLEEDIESEFSRDKD